MRGCAVGRRGGFPLVVVLVGVVCSLLGWLAASASAAPVTYTVATTTDGAPGSCTGTVCPTLRDAVTAANLNPGSTIQLGAGTFQLSAGAGAPEIVANMTIDGQGPALTTIAQTLAGAGVIRVAAAATAAISGVTITGGTLHGTNQLSGNTAGGIAEGGGINSWGELTLSDDDVSQNTATGGNGHGTGAGGEAQGGGVYNQEGSLTIDDSSFSQDTATAGSGGASGQPGVPFGGALGNNEGRVTVNDSTFAHDFVAGGSGFGGAIHSLGTLTVEQSTIGPSNEAGFVGGGIETEHGSTTTIVNTTIFDNNAGFGGGLFGVGTVSLASDTFDANEARVEGGNIGTSTAGTIDLSDTIIANGVATSAGTGNCVEVGVSGAFLDRGHNLETDSPTSQCGLGAAGMSDLLVSNAFLASALGANGGPTQTLALLPGAPEIGTGGACTAAAGLDQRGLPRPAACDIGAFQTQLPANTTPPGLSGVAQVGHTLSCSQGTWTGDGPLNASDAVGALSFSYQWLRGGVAIAGAALPGYTLQAADAGQQLACRVTATGAYGQTSAVSATVAVPAAVAALPLLTVVVAPQVSAVSQSVSKWLESNLLASISKAARKLPVGTTFRFTLSQAASVVFAFTQTRSGRKVGKSCLAQTKHNAKKHPCTRTVTVATLSFSGHAGTNKVRFGGRVSTHVKLKPGRYTLVITATTSGKRSTPHSLSFTIATPKR